ncbi:MAG TPA: hypothetical protein VFR80_11750, partial [Pyrinomonadaceae bacterium]|nr:hypothetical protein [Pyrinomonadaceae bacterium]
MRFSKWLGHRAVLPARYLFVVAISLLTCVDPVAAQESEELTPPKVEGKVIVGGANFREEIPHGVAGASFRVYVTKRLSIEPEYLYLYHSENDQDQIIQPNIAYDFTDPRKRFVAYGILGVGVLHHKGRFLGNDFDTGEPRVFDTSFTTWTASVGGGVKMF